MLEHLATWIKRIQVSSKKDAEHFYVYAQRMADDTNKILKKLKDTQKNLETHKETRQFLQLAEQNIEPHIKARIEALVEIGGYLNNILKLDGTNPRSDEVQNYVREIQAVLAFLSIDQQKENKQLQNALSAIDTNLKMLNQEKDQFRHLLAELQEEMKKTTG